MTPRQELKDFDIAPTFDDDDSHADMYAEQWYSDAAAFMSEATKVDAVGKGTDKRLKRLSGFDYCAASIICIWCSTAVAWSSSRMRHLRATTLWCLLGHQPMNPSPRHS